MQDSLIGGSVGRCRRSTTALLAATILVVAGCSARVEAGDAEPAPGSSIAPAVESTSSSTSSVDSSPESTRDAARQPDPTSLGASTTDGVNETDQTPATSSVKTTTPSTLIFVDTDASGATYVHTLPPPQPTGATQPTAPTETTGSTEVPETTAQTIDYSRPCRTVPTTIPGDWFCDGYDPGGE